jgi:hypothetical protein
LLVCLSLQTVSNGVLSNMLNSLPKLAVLVFASLVLPGLSACSVAPVQEMSDARQAVSAAEQAGAADYASESLGRAQELLHNAESKLSQRRYNEARKEANAAKAEALVALRTAEQTRESEKP